VKERGGGPGEAEQTLRPAKMSAAAMETHIVYFCFVAVFSERVQGNDMKYEKRLRCCQPVCLEIEGEENETERILKPSIRPPSNAQQTVVWLVLAAKRWLCLARSVGVSPY
jgi:hypothetical protein